MFRVIIAGTRTFDNYVLLQKECDRLLSAKASTDEIIIISGNARGADLLGERYAQEHNYKIQRFPADWDKHGKKAGILRNREMADNSDALIAFWDGMSRGTLSMINIARNKALQVRVIKY